MNGRVLIIAGSDSGGGAGIQADIKAVTAMGGFAATAITALTAQNTLGVHDIMPVPVEFIARQAECVLADIGADAIKTGMMFSPEVVETITNVVNDAAPATKWVLDPVMVAKGGAKLLLPQAQAALREVAVPRAHLVTPNIPEAEMLCGMAINKHDDMRAAGEKILSLGPAAVLMKGGHLDGEEVHDMLIERERFTTYRHQRLATAATHGTGCTLASAIAAGIALGYELPEAVETARQYLLQAMRTAWGLGKGHGPLNHGWNANLER